MFPCCEGGSVSASGAAARAGVDDAALLQVVPSWGRFLALCAVLEGSLTDIADWLPSRKFASFTGKEMTGLVKALFEDSAKRNAVLSSIAQMS